MDLTQLIERQERLEAENLQLRAENQKLRKLVSQLQERLGQNSSNSHRPPSSDGPQVQRGTKKQEPQERKKRRQGGQKGRRGQHRELRPVEEASEIIKHKAEACSCCGEVLEGEDSKPWRHQVVELPTLKISLVPTRSVSANPQQY